MCKPIAVSRTSIFGKLTCARRLRIFATELRPAKLVNDFRLIDQPCTFPRIFFATVVFVGRSLIYRSLDDVFSCANTHGGTTHRGSNVTRVGEPHVVERHFGWISSPERDQGGVRGGSLVRSGTAPRLLHVHSRWPECIWPEWHLLGRNGYELSRKATPKKKYSYGCTFPRTFITFVGISMECVRVEQRLTLYSTYWTMKANSWAGDMSGSGPTHSQEDRIRLCSFIGWKA